MPRAIAPAEPNRLFSFCLECVKTVPMLAPSIDMSKHRAAHVRLRATGWTIEVVPVRRPALTPRSAP